MNWLAQHFKALSIAMLLFLISLISAAQVGDDVVMSSFISPQSNRASVYFGSSISVRSGGIVPDGRVEFFYNGKTIEDDQVTPYVKDGIPGVRYQGRFYALDSGSLPIEPLAAYVRDGAEIAFTMPPSSVGIDQQFLRQQRLVPSSAGEFNPGDIKPDSPKWYKDAQLGRLMYSTLDCYIAKEFADTEFEHLLIAADLHQDIISIPEELESQIILDLLPADNGYGVSFPGEDASDDRMSEYFQGIVEYSTPGSYVNADFHVTYRAELVSGADGNRIECQGRPLRYYWHIFRGNQACVYGVACFSQPSAEDVVLKESIGLFQRAALFRELNENHPDKYNHFVEVLYKRDSYGPSNLFVITIALGSLVFALCILAMVLRVIRG